MCWNYAQYNAPHFVDVECCLCSPGIFIWTFKSTAFELKSVCSVNSQFLGSDYMFYLCTKSPHPLIKALME